MLSKADNYRPISPTISVANVMERRVNARLIWLWLENHQCRQGIFRDGVPKACVLSSKLFIIFMNDVLNEIPACIHGALYADDLVMLCS